jgi:hypothetical protein
MQEVYVMVDDPAFDRFPVLGRTKYLSWDIWENQEVKPAGDDRYEITGIIRQIRSIICSYILKPRHMMIR